MCIFTKKFRTFDPHLPIVQDKVLKKNGYFFWHLPLLIRDNDEDAGDGKESDCLGGFGKQGGRFNNIVDKLWLEVPQESSLFNMYQSSLL